MAAAASQLGNEEGTAGSITRQQQQRPWRGLRGLSEASLPSRGRGSNYIVGLSWRANGGFAQVAIAPRYSSSSSSTIDENAHDSEEGAFNYIHTQSKPKSSSTLHQLRNTSIVPAHDVLILQPTPTQSSQSSVTKLQPLARNIDGRNGNNNNINLAIAKRYWWY
jgi:hypothetical protein